MDERTRVALSKKMTYLLRHVNGFTDQEGWVSVERLVGELRKWFPWVRKEDVLYVVSRDEKGRYELKGDKIRARYGHTVNVKLDLPIAQDVEVLYHGTSCEAYKRILKEGIVPMRRKMVHLTTSEEEAIENAKRKGRCIKVIIVDATCLRSKGHEVFKAGKHVHVTDYVPPECIIGTLEIPSRV